MNDFVSRSLRVFCTSVAGLGLASSVSGTEVSRPASGVVVAAHPAAAEAGRRVLAEGGNAIDAAVAVGMTLSVAEPWGSGLGGKLVLVYADANSNQVHTIEALEQASQALDTETFTALPKASRETGPESIGVPGMLAGWDEAHRRWGTRPWPTLLQPAIEAAREGVVVDHYDHHALIEAQDKLSVGGGFELFAPDGQVPTPGDRITQPDQARSLSLIAEGGASVLYGGELGRRMADHIRSIGGQITIKDLENYRPVVRTALSVEYAGAQIYAAPPPATGGATLLLALACLDKWDDGHKPAAVQATLPDRLDAEARVLFHLYPLIRRQLGSRVNADAKLNALMQPDRLATLREEARAFDPQAFARQAQALDRSADVLAQDSAYEPGCTTHFVVVDYQGNIVSATQSLSHHYGSGIAIPGTGIVMNNSLNNFAVRTPSSPNYAGPGLRPRSTMTPIIVKRGAQPILAAGAAGGQRIPTAVLRLVRDVLDHRVTLDQAVHQPRIHFRHALSGTDRLSYHLEPGPDTPGLAEQLRQRGWRPETLGHRTMYFGGVNAAEAVQGESWIGVADDRRTNSALPAFARPIDNKPGGTP